MTRLLVVSDLHLELGPRASYDPYKEQHLIPDADIALVAGDIHKPVEQAIAYLMATLARRMPVVYVAGNHEFYRHNIDAELAIGLDHAAIRTDYCNEIHMLENSSIELAGIRFLGATLWTDYALYATELEGKERDLEIMKGMGAADALLNDHRLIRTREANGVSRRFEAKHALARHRESRAFLEGALAQPFDGPTVVLTHHAPHPGSVEPRFAKSAATPAFASDLSSVITEHQPAAWIHGHVHSSHDYLVGQTRIVANPAGYVVDARLENPDFDAGKIIEIDTKLVR